MFAYRKRSGAIRIWNPGEAISPLVKRGDNDVKKVGTGLTFLKWSPEGASLRSVFNWYFGGTIGAGFGDAEADAAVAQLSDTGGSVIADTRQTDGQYSRLSRTTRVRS